MITKFSNRNAVIHWISVIIITILISTGLISSYFEFEEKDGSILQAHIFIGIFILIISFIRIFTILKDPRPKDLDTINKAHKILKKSVQLLLYFLVLIAPLSGLIVIINSPVDLEILETRPEMFFTQEIISLIDYHKVFVYSLITFTFVHIAGILLQIIRTKENILKRMWVENEE